MQIVDTLIIPRWLVPVDPIAAVLTEHAVAVHAGEIVAIGPHADLSVRFQAKESVHLSEHALLPGWVNAHAHSPMVLMRGFADDLPLMTWLGEHVWPAEARMLSAEFVADGSALSVLEMVRGGTTCVQENYFFPTAAAATFKAMGMRALVGAPIIEFPSAWAATIDDYFAQGVALIEAWRNDPLVQCNLAPHAPYTVHDSSFERIATLADELDVRVQMHVHETAQEIRDSMQQYGMRPLQRLSALGVVNERLNAVHMTQLIGSEIELCAQQNVHVLHCPQSNLKLASGFAPIADLQRAGVNIAIGTDGAASNNDLDMLDELRTGALLAKAVAGDAQAFSATQALAAATMGGARALGLEHRIGSITVGKRADLIAIDLSHARTQPVFHPISQVVYAASSEQVTEVWIDGVRKLKAGILLDMDCEAILARARQWAMKLRL